MNRGAWIVALLIGIVIGYLAGIGFPGLEQTNESPVGSAQESVSESSIPSGNISELKQDGQSPIQLQALEHTDWLYNEFLPLAAMAYTQADLQTIRQPIDGMPNLSALLGAPGLQNAWEQAAIASFGPSGAHIVPLIGQCTKLGIFILPSTKPPLPCDVVLYAQLPELDVNHLQTNLLTPISQAVAGSASVVESVSGYPIYGVRGDTGELMALAVSDGLWVANHRAVIDNLLAAHPGEVTPTTPPGDTPLFADHQPWLTTVIRRPQGAVSEKDILAWLWNSPWQFSTLRLEADARESGSTIAAAFSIRDETTSAQDWTPYFASSAKRAPISLGQLGISLPSFMNEERRGGRRDRGRTSDELNAPRETSFSPESTGEAPSPNRDSREPMRRRMERRGFAPPVQSFVMDWIATGKPEPAWVIQLVDSDGRIQRWFKAIADGSSPLSETVTVETVHNGTATEFFFEGGPFVEWFGLDRFMASYELPNGVVLFQDEAVLENLPVLLAPPDNSEASSASPLNDLYAYADLSPELLQALIVFESGGPENAEPMMAFLKPFISSLRIQVTKEGNRIVFRSTADHSPGNWIGLTALGNAIYLYMNR